MAQARVFLGPRNFWICELIFQATIQVARFLQVPPKSLFKRLVLSTGLWQHAKMSTTLKAPYRLKDLEFKKGQLSSWQTVLYVPVTDLVATKEEPHILKVRLPDDTVLNICIYSRGNTKEYLAHIVAVICSIKQEGWDTKCRKLVKAVVKLIGMFRDLLKAAGSKETVLLDDDVEAHKLEIEETQKMLQETQNQHNKAIAKTYEQLRNLLSGGPQSQWDRVYLEMHKRDLWAGVNGQVTVGRRPHT